MANNKKKKHPKVRIKTSAKRALIFIFFFLCVAIYAHNQITEIRAEYAYQKTYEYKLVQHGYTLEQTQIFLSKIDDNQLDYLLNNDPEDFLYNLVKEKYFMKKNFNAYLSYRNSHMSYNMETIVAIVNVHANNGWYGVSYDTNISLNELMLVNKFYHLNEDYQRDDLVKVPLQHSYGENYIASTVYDHFMQMNDAIKSEMNIDLMVTSGYRSYQDQTNSYERYKRRGQSYADAYSARPGYSEHQTGLALDIVSLQHSGNSAFTQSEEFQWLKSNCYKYGFILRYEDDKEIITGFDGESWHYRYVGTEVAKKIHDEGITFDEYYAFYIEK